jgi:hypothetical protein
MLPAGHVPWWAPRVLKGFISERLVNFILVWPMRSTAQSLISAICSVAIQFFSDKAD